MKIWLIAKKKALHIVQKVEDAFSSRVAKAILLVLGLWTVLPRPNISKT